MKLRLEGWRRQVAIVGGFLLLAFGIWIVAGGGPLRLDLGAPTRYANEVFYSPIRHRLLTMVFTPVFVVVILFTLVLERLIPARPNPKLFSASSLQDAAWFFYEAILHAVIVATWVALIQWAYQSAGGTIVVPGLEKLSEGWRFLIGILVLDLCMYVQHRVNHVVPWLWQFHTVHHSQKDLNFFTDFRYHLLEYVVRETFLAIPLLLMGVRVPDIVVFSIVRRWYTRFYHANIRTNLGPLRYVLVTPQSHRIHHSIEPRHRDKNFAALFSIWDFLLGTQYRGWNEYPETGIEDERFPHETTRDLGSLLLMPLRQMLYPLRQIWRQITGRRASDRAPS